MNDEPTTNQRKYLGLLLSRAHERGVPHLPIEALSRKQVSDWIDYLKTVVDVEGSNRSPRDPRTYLPVRRESYGYRPSGNNPTLPDHQHTIEPWATEDGFEVIECATCGSQW